MLDRMRRLPHLGGAAARRRAAAGVDRASSTSWWVRLAADVLALGLAGRGRRRARRRPARLARSGSSRCRRSAASGCSSPSTCSPAASRSSCCATSTQRCRRSRWPRGSGSGPRPGRVQLAVLSAARCRGRAVGATSPGSSGSTTSAPSSGSAECLREPRAEPDQRGARDPLGPGPHARAADQLAGVVQADHEARPEHAGRARRRRPAAAPRAATRPGRARRTAGRPRRSRRRPSGSGSCSAARRGTASRRRAAPRPSSSAGRRARRIAAIPSHSRYSPPSSFTTPNTCAEEASSADRPAVAAAMCTAIPPARPRTAAKPARRPPLSTRLVSSAWFGPGVRISSTDRPRNVSTPPDGSVAQRRGRQPRRPSTSRRGSSATTGSSAATTSRRGRAVARLRGEHRVQQLGERRRRAPRQRGGRARELREAHRRVRRAAPRPGPRGNGGSPVMRAEHRHAEPEHVGGAGRARRACGRTAPGPCRRRCRPAW